MSVSVRNHLVFFQTICLIALFAHSQAQSTSFGSIALTCSSTGQSTADFSTIIPYSSFSFIIVEAEASIILPLEILLVATIEDQIFFLFTSVLIKNSRAYTVIDTSKIPPQYSSKLFNVQCINSSGMTIPINFNFKGSNSMISDTDYSCLFNCSNDIGNGECSASSVCQCSEGFFGIDCGIEGENIQHYLGNLSLSSTSFQGSKLFFLSTSSYDFNSKFIQMNSIVSQNMKIYTYHGSQSSFLINDSYDLSSVSAIQTQELVFNFSSTSDYVYVILQDLTSDSVVSISLSFSIETIDTDDYGFLSGRNVIGIIIIFLISLFSLLIFIAIVFSIRSLYNYYHRTEIALYKNNQMQIQIEQKMPSQTHGQLLQHFPNLSEIPECNICLEEFIPNDKVRLTHCFHVFHTSCLTEWMLSRHSLLCPLCRKSCQESDAEAITLYKLKMRSENNSPHELTQADTIPHKSDKNPNSENKKLQSQGKNSLEHTPVDTAETIKEKNSSNSQEIPDSPDKISNKEPQAVNKSTHDHQTICITPRTETDQEHFFSKQPFFKETNQAEQPQGLQLLTKQQPLQTQQASIPKFRSE